MSSIGWTSAMRRRAASAARAGVGFSPSSASSASRALTTVGAVAGEGRAVLDLQPAHHRGGLGQGGVALSNQRRAADPGERLESADAKAGARLALPAQLAQPPQVEIAARLERTGIEVDEEI